MHLGHQSCEKYKLAFEISRLIPIDIGFFRIWKTRNAYRNTYKQHSAALKWLRHVHNPAAVAADSSAAVAADGASEPEPVVLQPYGMQVAQCLHPKGMEYSFDENVMLDWSWLEMVAQLDEDSMFEVVGDGLVRCEFSRPRLRVFPGP